MTEDSKPVGSGESIYSYFILLMKHLLFGIDVSSCVGSLCLRSQTISVVMPG